MARTAELERFRSLPLPTTSDEHWRFTDLRGFDPESFDGAGATPPAAAAGMVDVETAGVALVTEAGIEIEQAPAGVVFEPLADHPRLGQLVGTDEKFAAHNAACWEHGLLVTVPRGVVLEQPL